MLIDIPKFQKRLKEKILWALHVPKRKTQLGEGSQTPRAVLQTLNILSLPAKPTIEDAEFRESLANYYYSDTRDDGVNIDGLPYICVNPYQPRRTGPIESSYPILEGSPEEIGDYLAKETEQSSTQIQYGLPDDPIQAHPFSSINIQIPWHEKGETIENLPTPKQTTELARKLTSKHRTQVTLLIAGPKLHVDEYVKSLQKELNTEYKHTFPICNIVVQEGYITSSHAARKEEWEQYQETKKSERNQKNLEDCLQTCENLAEGYVEAVEKLITLKRATEKAKKEWTDQKLGQTLPEKTLQTKISFEQAHSELRRSSLIWFYKIKMPQDLREERQGIVERENQLEKNFVSYSKALEKLKTLEGETQEKQKTSLQETHAYLVEETKTIAQSWMGLQKRILQEMLQNTARFQYHPWRLHAIHIRNQNGFFKPFVWEPIHIDTPTWSLNQTELLAQQLQDTHLEDSHLGKYSFDTQKIEYPTQKAKTLPNPGVFQKLPSNLKSPTSLEALQTPAKNPTLKLDIRLNPRPDLATEILLENDNHQITLYNPVSGRPTGFKEATLWRPIFTRKGIPHVEETLKAFGYELEVSEQVHNYVERKVRQAERFLAPNYPLTQYEALAYYENGSRRAEKTIDHPETGEPLWIEGKSYHITPSWKRQTMLVDHSVEEEEQSAEIQEEIQKAEAQDIVTIGQSSSLSRIDNSTRIKTLTERRINFGFSTFLVEAEGGHVYEIQETVSKDTLAMEKERIALEIDHTNQRIEELTKKEKKSKSETNELKKLQETLEIKTQELDHWAPMLEDFISAFPPEAPPLTAEIHSERIAQAAKRIYARFAPWVKENPEDEKTSLKDYQLQWAAVGAIKRSHCNSSSPGAGKTLMAIMASWEMGHHYNWVICPTIAMKTWAKELDRVGLHHEIVGYKKTQQGDWESRPNVYEHTKELTQRFHKRIRTKNRLGLIEPEFYIVSAENVALGGEGNKTYSPWHYDYTIQKENKFLEALEEKKIEIPSHWHLFRDEKGLNLRVWSDRPDNSKELSKAGIREFTKPIRFRKAITECPRCQANGTAWSKTGHCKNCKHQHSAVTKQKTHWNAKTHSPRLSLPFSHMSRPPEAGSEWRGEKASHKQYPLYKIMGKHVGCKIIDEVHNWSNFHSQHGAALLQVRSKDTIILSGTLCKTHISELEPSLCQIYEPNSGEFPYSPWGMDLFREQFETLEIENRFQQIQDNNSQLTRRRSNSKVVPEASNLTKLRALLHGVLCTVGETEMERVWQLKPIRESIRYVELQQNNAEIYQNWERLLREAYSECKTEHERVGMLRRARSQMTNLAYACDGPEKLEAAIAWIQEGMENNQRSVVVGPSTRFHKMLCQALKERNIPFASMGNLSPDKRFEFLNKFRESDCPNFISRIRLVNVNFNQLTCCTRILFTGIDPSPAAIRQMQKRLNRIGQTQSVHCTFLISQLPPQPRRQVNDVLTEIQSQLDPTRQPIQQDEPDNRPPSYEERLFALVLRRENAIKQTLQQADRQRDPQELYEMLKDRQTLNQVLKDIVEDAKSDEGVDQIIKAMASENGLQPDIPTKVSTNLSEIIKNSNLPAIQTPQEKNPIAPETSALQHLPQKDIAWKPVKTLSPLLQGEFFNL